MLRAAFMAALHCPNPECPFLKKFRAPAEYREGFSACSDCGSALVAGSAPALAPAAAVEEPSARAPVSLPRAEGASGEFTRRLAISLGVMLAAALSDQVLLPGVDPFIRESLELSGMPPDVDLALSVFSLALNPLLAAFVIVELAALLIPRWRRLRTGGPRARSHLRSAALQLGLVLAFIQSLGMTRFYSSFNFEGRTLFSGPNALPMPALMLLLVGGVLLLHLLTVLVDKVGLGNGYAVVLLGLALAPAFRTASYVLDLMRQGLVTSATVGLLVVGLAAVVWATARLLRGRLPGVGSSTERPRWLPLPASGLAPVALAGAVLAVPAILDNLLGLTLFSEVSRMLESSVLLHSAVFFVLSTLLTAGFSVLFHQPQRVGALWAALTAKDEPERGVVHARVVLRARELLPTAAAWSLAFTALGWVPALLARIYLQIPLPSILALHLGVAIMLDLLDEARMRRAGTWVSAWPVHRSYEVEPALAALSAAGIPAWARGACARATLQFFGPYFPIDLMVPPDRAEEAHALLEKSRQG